MSMTFPENYAEILSAATRRTNHSNALDLAANKRLVSRMFIEIVNDAAYDVADEIFAPDFYWPQFDLHGPDGVRAWARTFHEGWPGVKDRLDLQVAEGDVVVSMVTVYGIQSGPWLGYPPSNRFAAYPAIGIDRIANGQIVERSATFNLADVLRQLGHTLSGE